MYTLISFKFLQKLKFITTLIFIFAYNAFDYYFSHINSYEIIEEIYLNIIKTYQILNSISGLPHFPRGNHNNKSNERYKDNRILDINGEQEIGHAS